ncbi:hypothetical protein [Saccharospirillum sp.]|uniref:hypothetical protein n=1 Tax=Saccharospirillum sp. TaxID=2033801 RepID=UPI00349FE8B9
MDYKLSDIKRRSYWLKPWVFLLQIFFILMLVLPTTFQTPRGGFLVLLTGIAGVVALKTWRVHRDILLLWLAIIAVGLFGVVWGVINSAPGALRIASVFLIWPALYLLFIGLAHDPKVIRAIESALLAGITLATAMSLTVMMVGLLGYGGLIYPFLEFQGAGFGNYGGFIEFRTYSLTTVMYGFPFVLSFILVRRGELRGLKKIGVYLLLLAITCYCSGGVGLWTASILVGDVANSFYFIVFFAAVVMSIKSNSSLLSDIQGFGVSLSCHWWCNRGDWARSGGFDRKLHCGVSRARGV